MSWKAFVKLVEYQYEFYGFNLLLKKGFQKKKQKKQKEKKNTRGRERKLKKISVDIATNHYNSPDVLKRNCFISSINGFVLVFCGVLLLFLPLCRPIGDVVQTRPNSCQMQEGSSGFLHLLIITLWGFLCTSLFKRQCVTRYFFWLQ